MGFWRESVQQKALERKVSELSNSQQSVQTLSLWLIHLPKHPVLIVSMWERELQKLEVVKIHCLADVR
uniref:CID domain-containing protein n=1 Tax=Phasianus colchicus TaxID=9054 RepID=A0A669QH58_PHACC